MSIQTETDLKEILVYDSAPDGAKCLVPQCNLLTSCM